MKKIKVCSLFSGIGGFETGLFQAFGKENVEVVFASEIDAFASKSYEYIYGHAPHGDITQIHEKDIPDHDLLVAGFPCQAFSISGKRGGFSDTRGTLFFEIARIAKEKKPKVMLLENVKGLLNHNKGQTIDTIIEVLSELNYKVDFTLLNSKFFDVAQSRERVFIVCVRDEKGQEWEVEKIKNTLSQTKQRLKESGKINMFRFDFPKQENVSTCIQDVLEKEVDQKYYLSYEKTHRLLAQITSDYTKEEQDFLIDDQGRTKKKLKPLHISPTLRREMHGNEPRVVEVRNMSPEMIMVGLLDMKGNDSIRRVYHPNGVCPTLTTMGGGHREPKILCEEENKVFQIRKIMPLECFRLQSFPDTYFHILKEHKISDTQLYKMAGNAVTANVIKAIALQLRPYL